MAEVAVGHIIMLGQEVWLGRNQNGLYLDGLMPNRYIPCKVTGNTVSYKLGENERTAEFVYKQDQDTESSV